MGGWKTAGLPSSGKNFEIYSSMGAIAGRNYVHSKVYEVIVAAYQILESKAPGGFGPRSSSWFIF